jgi:proteasome activator subunit 4
VGQTLHIAASATHNVGESDNSVESVRSLVITIGTYLTTYGLKAKQFSGAQAAYAGMQSTKKMYDSQRKFHRSVFMGAATVHHQNRLSSINFYRKRSALDDRLIRNMLDFCLSPFTRIRRSSQAQLESITRVYRGSSVLCLSTLFDNLQPGTDPDRMKGALYVLRYNTVGLAHLGRRWIPGNLVRIIETLLNAHHETKASVQALVTKALDELLSLVREPSTSLKRYRVNDVDRAVDSMVEAIRYKPNPALVQEVHDNLLRAKTVQDEQWDLLVDRVIAIATAPQLGWRYVMASSRVLVQIGRRDRPADIRLAKFHAQFLLNSHPELRELGVTYVTLILL